MTSINWAQAGQICVILIGLAVFMSLWIVMGAEQKDESYDWPEDKDWLKPSEKQHLIDAQLAWRARVQENMSDHPSFPEYDGAFMLDTPDEAA